MPWNNQGGGNNGGGPWGQGGGGGGPWGQGGGGGQPPQDIDALFRQGRDAWRRMMPGGGASSGRTVTLLVLVSMCLNNTCDDTSLRKKEGATLQTKEASGMLLHVRTTMSRPYS